MKINLCYRHRLKGQDMGLYQREFEVPDDQDVRYVLRKLGGDTLTECIPDVEFYESVGLPLRSGKLKDNGNYAISLVGRDGHVSFLKDFMSRDPRLDSDDG